MWGWQEAQRLLNTIKLVIEKIAKEVNHDSA
jgi:hypothetical protein